MNRLCFRPYIFRNGSTIPKKQRRPQSFCSFIWQRLSEMYGLLENRLYSIVFFLWLLWTFSLGLFWRKIDKACALLVRSICLLSRVVLIQLICKICNFWKIIITHFVEKTYFFLPVHAGHGHLVSFKKSFEKNLFWI